MITRSWTNVIAVGFLAVSVAVIGAPAQPLLYGDAAPVRSCESLSGVDLQNASVQTATNHAGDDSGPAACRVTVIARRPGTDSRITIWIWLPSRGWNGRFQGRGGGGFSGGNEAGLRGPVAQGFSAGATDTGHEGGNGSFALDENNRLRWQSIRDNAYLGIHEMTVVGKALTEAYYGRPPGYSYFNGCSTGGRQGLSEAQRFPGDYDGILSGCPAINWPQLHAAQMWGQLVMLERGHVVPQCKFEAAREWSVAVCDELDGVKDGLVEDPTACTVNVNALLDLSPDGCGALTAEDAAVIAEIWRGPRRKNGEFLWYGLPYGSAFRGLTNTSGDPLAGDPFRISLQWFRYFLTEDPEWDWKTLTRDSYEQFWDQSMEQYRAVLGTDNPDLSGFRDAGGKMVLWHGWVDPLIYPEGTIDYYERVEEVMGGREATSEFLRLFMAPGVAHCRGGDGPQPTRHFEALRRWVEEGEAPETLEGVADNRTRPLCRYPLTAHYDGSGSVDEAENFVCR